MGEQNMTAQDIALLWEAGGPMLLGLAVVIGAVVYDKRRPKNDEHGEALAGLMKSLEGLSRSLDATSGKLDVLRIEFANKIGRIETRLDDQQRHLDRLDRN